MRMFTAADRNLVMQRLLDLARADPAIAGAAITGRSQRAAVTAGPTSTWRSGSAGQTTSRVFLLPGWLEADIAFMPAADFGPGGPAWRTVFGTSLPLPRPGLSDIGELAGRAWHHVLHARACIARDRFWQAEYWISGLRDLVLALACARLGYPVSYGKGAHLLPAELTEPLQAALVASLDPAELRRTLAAAATALGEELNRADPQLASRLLPLLGELAGAAN